MSKLGGETPIPVALTLDAWCLALGVFKAHRLLVETPISPKLWAEIDAICATIEHALEQAGKR